MHLWTLDAEARPLPSLDRAPIDGALAHVITCIGQGDFGSVAIAGLNGLLAVDSWSIYRVHRDRPPQLHASGSYRIPDTTESCFRAYRDGGLYRVDASFEDARLRAGGRDAVMTHWRADELPEAHRERIYRQHGMRERLSLVHTDGSGGLVAVNLYRHQHQHPFENGDFELMRATARSLLACVDRHIALAGRAAAPPLDVAADEGACGTTDALKQLCPALTGRELQICERLLRGWTHDGIAGDLGLSVATVKTYRNRAFGRLGIHFRNELFGLVRRTEATVPDPGKTRRPPG